MICSLTGICPRSVVCKGVTIARERGMVMMLLIAGRCPQKVVQMMWSTKVCCLPVYRLPP
jgi:hypothetical protein